MNWPCWVQVQPPVEGSAAKGLIPVISASLGFLHGLDPIRNGLGLQTRIVVERNSE